MTIKTPQEVDAFFLTEIERRDRNEMHLLSIKLLLIYIECLSEYLNINFRDTHHLAKEMAYHSICIYLDTTYRINKANPKFNSSNSKDLSEDLLINLFSSNISKLSMSSSRILRIKVANLISFSTKTHNLFDDNNEEPSLTRLNKIRLRPSLTELMLRLFYNLKFKIPNYLLNHFIVLFILFKNIFNKELISVGYISIQKKYFFQIPGIKFVPINFDLNAYLEDVTFSDLYSFGTVAAISIMERFIKLIAFIAPLLSPFSTLLLTNSIT